MAEPETPEKIPHPQNKWRLYIPAIIVFIFCNVLFFTPGKDLPEVGDWFGEFSIDKLIHTGFFAVMAFLFIFPILKTSRPDKKRYIILICLAFCGWGVLVEVIQKYFIPGRSFSVLDMLADALGAVLAFFISTIFFRNNIKKTAA